MLLLGRFSLCTAVFIEPLICRSGITVGVRADVCHTCDALRRDEPPVGQLLQLVPRPCEVPHKVPVEARLLSAHGFEADGLPGQTTMCAILAIAVIQSSRKPLHCRLDSDGSAVDTGWTTSNTQRVAVC